MGPGIWGGRGGGGGGFNKCGQQQHTAHTPPLLGCACVLPISYLCVCIIGVVSYYDTYVPTYLYL